MGDRDQPSDRRRAERVPVNTAFAGLPGTTFVSNLSEHGVFVHTEEAVAIGTEIDLRFTVLLEDPVLLAGRGRVVRHQDDPPGMGVEFVELDPEMILRINDVVTQRRPVSSGPPIPTEDLEGAKTVARRRPEILPTRDFRARLVTAGHPALGRHDGGGEGAEDPESATTLVNLKRVEVEIADDDELPPGIPRSASKEDPR